MEGTKENHQYGVSYRVIQKIFNLLQFKERKHNSSQTLSGTLDSKFEFSIEVSMLEIYNDEIYDLLTPESTDRVGNGQDKRKGSSLDIRRGADNMIEVVHLSKEKVSCIQDVMDLLSRGNANRATAATNLNKDSSRSHMVLNVRITSGVVDQNQSIGNLFLVDLAGSERVRKSAVEGKELKEAQHINKSLSALGNVMEALDRKASHVPYRNSKLTYLLQDALSGNSKTMMLVTVCPTANSFDETSTALQFATRARRINLGVAQRNVKSKNLEETVKSLTAEMKVLAKAKKRKDEQLDELKKSHERIQDRLSKSQESRSKVSQEESRALAVLRKNNVEVAARYQKEKSLREENTVELERLQQELRHHQHQLAALNRDKENASNKQLDQENEVLALKKQLRIATEALSASNIRLRTSQIFLNSTSPTPRKSISKGFTQRSKRTPRKTPGSLNNAELAEVQEKVISLLKRHDPTKVDKVDLLMDKFRGNEKSLLTKLVDRYEGDNRSCKSDLSLEKMSVDSETSKPQPLPTSVQRRSQIAMNRHRERMTTIRQNGKV